MGKAGFKFYDWFDRDADEGYTYYDPTKRSMNWDKGLKNYSDFFFGNSSRNKDSVKEASGLLSTMSRVMGVSVDDFCGKRRMSGKVHIPTDMLSDGKDMDMDVFLGASLQNMAKFVHQTDDEIRLQHLAETSPTLERFVTRVLNEERVGKLMSDDTPGYLRFVKKYKEHKYKDRPDFDGDKSKQLLDLFDRIIRYPEQITEQEMEEFQKPIEAIKKLMLDSEGIPTEYKGCKKLGKKIAGVLQEYIVDPPSGEDDDKGDGDSGTGGSGSIEMESTPDESPKDSKKSSLSEEMKEYMKRLMANMAEKDSERPDMLKEMVNEIKSDRETKSSSEVNGKVDYIVPVASRYCINTYKRVLSKIDLSKASVISTLLKRKNRDYQFSLKSMRSGRLDTGKLAEAKQMVPTIYERMGTVKTNKLCVGVLIDESGSMGGSKEVVAREAAIMLNESLKNVPDVELFIYGHTADWCETGCSGNKSTQLFIYREPGNNNETALGGISGKYENRDGVAMMAAAKRMRQRTQNQGVFVIISDGSPHAADYSGYAATKHVRNMAIKIEQMGFQVIQVTIGGYKSTDMFKNVVDIANIEEFPTKFVALLKSKINDLIKQKVIL
jgi:hypothetical protein